MEISLHSGEKLLGNLKEWSDLVLSTARKNGICVDDKGSLATPPLCFILQWVHTVFIVLKKKLCFVKFTKWTYLLLMKLFLCYWGLFHLFLQHEFHRGPRNTEALVKFILDNLEVNLFDLWEGMCLFIILLPWDLRVDFFTWWPDI